MVKGLFDRGRIFADESVFESDWTPQEMPERQHEMEQIEEGLARIFGKGSSPQNMFLMGKNGQGKTALTHYVGEEIKEVAEARGIDVAFVEHSCEGSSSTYQFACGFVEEHTGTSPNGHPERKVLKKFFDVVEDLGDNVVLIIDEIDNLGTDDLLIKEVSRAKANHLDNTSLGLIGITTDSSFINNLSQGTKDSLGEKVIHFGAYDAPALETILSRRIKPGFQDGVVTNGAKTLCAGLAAKDKGSARQAIKYIHKAGEEALKEDADKVTEEHIRKAEERIKLREAVEAISGLTINEQLALVSVFIAADNENSPIATKEGYNTYCEASETVNNEPLTMKSYRGHLETLENLSLVTSQRRKGPGFAGKTLYWELDLPMDAARGTLTSISRLQSLNLQQSS